MKQSPSTHTHVVNERPFAATPAAVFQARADPRAKRRGSDRLVEPTTA